MTLTPNEMVLGGLVGLVMIATFATVSVILGSARRRRNIDDKLEQRWE